MPAGIFTVFSKNKDRLSELDLSTATIKMALITSVQTMNTTEVGNSIFADVSANDLATAFGYTAGGVALATPTITAVTNGFKFSTGNATWTAAGGSIPAHRYYVMYVVGTLWGRVNPLIGFFVGDTTPADIPATTTGNTLTATAPAAGWFDIT